MRRKIFVDCGAWKGTSIDFFRTYQPDAQEFEIFAFECNPLGVHWLKGIKDITRIEAAAWIKDEWRDFYISGYTIDIAQEGSTLFSDKSTGEIDARHPLKVEAIDFSRWVGENINPEDYAILKMNIEGAEYDVIDKMIADDTLNLFNRIYVQWHNKKIPSLADRHIKTTENLLEYGVPCFGWLLNHTGDGKPMEKWINYFKHTLETEEICV